VTARRSVPYQARGMRRRNSGLPHASGPSCVSRTANGCHPADAGAGEALTQSYTRTKGGITRRTGRPWNESQLVEQYDLRGCRWRHRLFSRQLHSRRDTASTGPKPVDGSDPATECRDFFRGRDAAPTEPKSGWLIQQHCRGRRRAEQPEEGRLSALCRNRGESARGLHAIRVSRTARISRSTR